jgi:ribonuclease P protein component
VTERLSSDERIRRRADYQRCYRGGRRRHGAFATLHFVPNSLGVARLGITATRKVGSAVERNRAKRRIREIYRRWPERQRLSSVDMVLHLKPAARDCRFDDLREDLLRLWRPLRRLEDHPS